MEKQNQKKKPQRNSRRGKGGNLVPDDVRAREGRGPEQSHSGPVQYSPQYPGSSAHFVSPHPQTPRFHPPQSGNQPTHWRMAPAQQRFGGPRHQPPFPHSGQQQPSIRQPIPRFETQPSMTQPREPHSTWGSKSAGNNAPDQCRKPTVAWSKKPQQFTEKTQNPKSAPGQVPIQHPEPGSVRPKQQPAKTAWGASYAGDSQQLQARDDAQCVSQETGKKAPEQSGFSKSSLKKPVDSGKKQGIGDKPLHESFEKDLVLGSSAEKSDLTKTMTKETAPDQTPIQDPPKRRRILKHSAKYFESEKGHPVQVNYLRINVKTMNFSIFSYAVDFSPRNPKTLYRDALRLFFDQYRINRYPAFDGRALLFAGGSRLQFPNELNAFEGTVQVTEGNESVEFHITIHLTGEINLETLCQYMRNGSSMNPYNTQALDLALMNAPINRNPDLIKVGRSFYSRPAQQISLGNGLDLWTGHFQGVVIPWLDETEKSPHLYLNVDLANKGFISDALSVIDYVRREFFSGRVQIPFGSDSSLTGWRLENAEKFLRTLKIDYQVPNQRRLCFKVASCGPSARRARFRLDNDRVETTVEQYFSTSKNIRLRYPNLPCLRDSRGRMFPMEFCTITSQAVNKQLEPIQSRRMVEQAACSTVDRKRKIERSIGNLDFANDRCMQEFGLRLNTTFETVNAYVLKPPTIQYQTSTVRVNNGKWDNDKFIQPMDLSKWVIVNTDSRNVQPHLIGQVVRNFGDAGRICGINVSDPQVIPLEPRREGGFNEQDFIDVFAVWKKKGATFFMVIMNTKINYIYNNIKRAAELAMYNVGVLTQCLRSETITKQIPNRRFLMTAKNMLLKLNAKISGVNHSLAAAPEVLNDHVMIVGADVTHPPPGSRELSIAAVAASHDEFGFQYNMRYRLQKSKQEIIVDLEEMIFEQIEFFRTKNNGEIPKHIFYYRDGVGESYFKQVRDMELEAIQNACAKFKAPHRIKITFLVVQKRHHTRFFPTREFSDITNKNQNVKPGTIVDEKITHPTEVNFFLTSHTSPMGTARPTKYHLLYDDSGIEQEELEQLTYYLCHMFARCNKSVSYPAPTYYAHHAAFRAKTWWAGQSYDENRLQENQRERGQIQDDVVSLNPMFFI